MSFGNNGNFRNNICWNVAKYIWDIERLNNKQNGKVIRIRTIKLNNIRNVKRYIRIDIKTELLEKYRYCIHCGIHKNLCIDHKNDMYNDARVLNEKTQVEDDFQVLCNKCNKDLKHHISNRKEKLTKQLHSVKDFGYFPNDIFEYPLQGKKSIKNI